MRCRDDPQPSEEGFNGSNGPFPLGRAAWRPGLRCTGAGRRREERTAESTDSVAGTVYVEEVIVTAERLKKGAMPTQSAIVQTYDALRRGKRLYNARRYDEALPYLLMAAQARLQVGAGDGGRHLPPRPRRCPAAHRVGNGMARRGRPPPERRRSSGATFARRWPRSRQVTTRASRTSWRISGRSGAAAIGACRAATR